MFYFSSLKTSERISLSFSLFWFFSLILFLLLVNITYFYVWYHEQEEKSFSTMNQNYSNYQKSNASAKDIEDFKWYLLTQDTIIVPKSWDLICSPWVEERIKLDPELILNRYFYKQDETIYFIYSKYFPDIWDVKVLFDTTSYINAQLVIIKIGLLFIAFMFLLQFVAWRYISRWLLRDLKNIGDKLKDIDINSRKKHIVCDCLPDDDEIKVLANALNNSYDTIDKQTLKLKQFLTDVSHEFKTPLMALSSRLDVLDKKIVKWKLQDEDIQKHFYDTRQNILKLNRLLESLFFLSSIEEQKWCLITTKISVRDFFEKKLKTIHESFSEKKLSYTLDIPDDLIYDVEQNTFWILLDNLLTNAMKFSPKNMKINISANENWFYVEDNWPWISDENREKIWEKFYRSDINKQWFWVWLYLVKRIIHMYNWNISIEQWCKKWAKFKVEISSEDTL